MSHSDPESPGGAGPAGTGTEQRLAEVVAAYRALQAENESYRERVSRNAERRFAQRHERLLLKFIDILDNLDRALDASELGSTGGAMIEGLILVRTQLLQTLQEEGLERIPVMGIPYDPEVAEAVGTQPVDDPDHHHVVMKDIRRGYRLKGKLARAAQVIVGEYQGELPASEREPEAPEPAEDSGRMEVVAEGSESTGELQALAAQAAAAVGGVGSGESGADDGLEDEDTGGLIGEVDLEAAAAEAAAMTDESADDAEIATGAGTGGAPGDDADGMDDDTDLETAAREAAAMAGEDDDAVPVFADDDAEDDGMSEGLIADADSLEQAAREAAALVGAEDEEAAAAPVPDPEAETGAGPGPEAGGAGRKARTPPLHPLDDVDPNAFEDPESESG